MSNYVFPSFQGWSWEKTITPVWNTQTYESESGRETRIQKWKYPRYKISLTYNFLTDNTSKWHLEKGDIERFRQSGDVVRCPDLFGSRLTERQKK